MAQQFTRSEKPAGDPSHKIRSKGGVLHLSGANVRNCSASRRMAVDLGQPVSEGDLIAEIDAQQIKARLDQAVATGS